MQAAHPKRAGGRPRGLFKIIINCLPDHLIIHFSGSQACPAPKIRNVQKGVFARVGGWPGARLHACFHPKLSGSECGKSPHATSIISCNLPSSEHRPVSVDPMSSKCGQVPQVGRMLIACGSGIIGRSGR